MAEAYNFTLATNITKHELRRHMALRKAAEAEVVVLRAEREAARLSLHRLELRHEALRERTRAFVAAFAGDDDARGNRSASLDADDAEVEATAIKLDAEFLRLRRAHARRTARARDMRAKALALKRATEVSVADDASQGSMDKDGCVVSSDSQQSNRSVTFVVCNATLLPCTWLASRGGSQCEHAPTIKLSPEIGSTAVKRLRHEQWLCRDRFFNDNLVKLRGDALLQASAPSEQLPLSPDTDLVILVDAFGLVSICHSTVDLLLPIAATARMLLGVASMVSLHNAASASRVRVYIVSESAHSFNRSHVPWRYIEAMQRAVLGRPLQWAHEITPHGTPPLRPPLTPLLPGYDTWQVGARDRSRTLSHHCAGNVPSPSPAQAHDPGRPVPGAAPCPCPAGDP
jgi:hypothetical protein